MEKVSIRFYNLCPDLLWKDYFELFGEFGEVHKLYTNPTEDYGKVQFLDMECAYNAYRTLNKKPPHNLGLCKPVQGQFIRSPTSNSNTSLDNSFSKSNKDCSWGSNNDSISNTHNNDDAFDASPSNTQYVDVYGRILDTLESEDGSDIFIPVSDLKKSGFEVYPRDSLPKPGEVQGFNEQLLKQHEIYLRAKSKEFMIATQQCHSKEDINHIIEKLQNECKSQYCQRIFNSEMVASSPNGSSLPMASSNVNFNRTERKYKNHQSSNDRRNGGFSRHSRNHQQGETNNTQHRDNRQRSQSRGRPAQQKPQSTNTDDIKKDKHVKNLQKPKMQETKIKPESKPPSQKNNGQLTNVTTEPKIPEEKIKTKVTFDMQTQNASCNNTASQPNRKISIEKESVEGCFLVTEIIDKDTFVGVALPQTYMEEISILEGIIDDCKAGPTFKPNVGDTIALPKDGSFVRGVVGKISNGQYTCALIDFGVVTSTTEAYPLPDKYKNIPEFACLCKADPSVVQEIVLDVEYPLQIKSAFQMTVTIGSKSEKVAEIGGSRWNPFGTSATVNEKPSATEKPSPEQLSEEDKALSKIPLKLNNLKSSDVVIIISVIESSLLVRTRECDIALKEVEQQLSNYKGNPFTEKPAVNDLLICPFKDGALYRGRVLSVTDKNVLIEYIDYGDSILIPIHELRCINEELANIPCTFIKLFLKGFKSCKFNEEALKCLEEYANRREKFTIILENDNTYDLLFRDKTSLSEKLSNLNKESKIISATNNTSAAVTPQRSSSSSKSSSLKSAPTTEMRPKISDIPKCKLSLGTNDVICLFAGDIALGTASFCINAEKMQENLLELSTQINSHIAKDSTPYHPHTHEVCLAKYEDEWYRAAVVKASDNSYGMFYLDFGNTKTLGAEDIRKMPKELACYECLSALCILQGVREGGLPVKEPLLSKLVTSIQENTLYTIEVINDDNNCYVITIPSLFDEWKKAGLLS